MPEQGLIGIELSIAFKAARIRGGVNSISNLETNEILKPTKQSQNRVNLAKED